MRVHTPCTRTHSFPQGIRLPSSSAAEEGVGNEGPAGEGSLHPRSETAASSLRLTPANLVDHPHLLSSQMKVT